MKVNPYYRGNRPHRASQIVFTMNTNPQQTYLQISKGTYPTDPNGLSNSFSRGPTRSEVRHQQDPLLRAPTPETDYVALNTTRFAFGTVNARKAVNYAMDRPALLRVFGFAGGKTTTAILPPSLAGGVEVTNPYPLNGTNPQKAKSLMGGNAATSASGTRPGRSGRRSRASSATT